MIHWMPLSEAALVLYDQLQDDALREVEHMDLDQVETPRGIEYLIKKMRKTYGEKALYRKSDLLTAYERIRRKPGEGIRTYCSRYLRTEEALRAINVRHGSRL